MDENQLNKILQEFYRSANEIFGRRLAEMILYGSYARGDHEEGSDIDIMILVTIARADLGAYRSQINDLAWRFGMDYDVLLSVSLDNASFFHDWKNDMPFYRNVWNEGMKISA